MAERGTHWLSEATLPVDGAYVPLLVIVMAIKYYISPGFSRLPYGRPSKAVAWCLVATPRILVDVASYWPASTGLEAHRTGVFADLDSFFLR